MRKLLGILIFLTIGLFACTNSSQQNNPTFLPSDAPIITPILLYPSVTIVVVSPTPPVPTPTFSPLPPTPSYTPRFEICSPLQTISKNELPDIVSNLFDPPQPGDDGGHQGTDLAFYRHGDRVGMLGLPVLSVLNGITAAVVKNRPPYGNMIIIETPLDALPTNLGELLQIPIILPTVTPPNLTCPSQAAFPNLDIHHRSLYLLYAHLNKPTSLNPDQAVSCGGVIGETGTTGMSVNPHLHLEVRIGPAGARFDGMAHYIGDATTQEMLNYCVWRVSGLFQMIDPMKLLSIKP
jgi:murein DD-endopeptidase MepM/ murein hydrolase activator NlpD